MWVGWCVWMVKVFRGFRFDVKLYEDFGRLASVAGVTVTGAFERFMSECVEGGGLVFPEHWSADFEVEARVLVDWLRKGKRFYRGEGGEEVNISGRLVWLLLRVRDVGLRREMEEELKRSVSEGRVRCCGFLAAIFILGPRRGMVLVRFLCLRSTPAPRRRVGRRVFPWDGGTLGVCVPEPCLASGTRIAAR